MNVVQIIKTALDNSGLDEELKARVVVALDNAIEAEEKEARETPKLPNYSQFCDQIVQNLRRTIMDVILLQRDDFMPDEAAYVGQRGEMKAQLLMAAHRIEEAINHIRTMRKYAADGRRIYGQF